MVLARFRWKPESEKKTTYHNTWIYNIPALQHAKVNPSCHDLNNFFFYGFYSVHFAKQSYNVSICKWNYEQNFKDVQNI